jgi:glycosyltransferase involved in cell wall biosynthesis
VPAVTGQPLLSFIVLSYNYEQYIGQTIRSILDQTIQDFEIVVVDDASTDTSREVVAAFNDPRIRLLVNDRNLGGAGSYNRAVSAARGEWLVNLDADDWIAPEKSAAQLDALARDPSLDIIGTHVAFVDTEGNPHPQREQMEAHTNHNMDLNHVQNWIGRNHLCRSSTMVRRAAHLRIGLDDPTMVRAPDYELWTRALRHGCRFELVPQPFTFYRLHTRGVTFGDPRGTYLELSYAMLRNLLPLIEAGALWQSLYQILNWLGEQSEFSRLTPGERYRLLGSMLMSPALSDFAAFTAMLEVEDDCSPLTQAGRRCLALLRTDPVVEKLRADNEAYIRARDWWHDQYDRFRNEVEAKRKSRWTPTNVARAVLSRCFRSS